MQPISLLFLLFPYLGVFIQPLININSDWQGVNDTDASNSRLLIKRRFATQQSYHTSKIIAARFTRP